MKDLKLLLLVFEWMLKVNELNNVFESSLKKLKKCLY